MVLGLETTLEHAKEELLEISDLEKELLSGDALAEAQIALDKLNRSIADFELYESKKKSDKVNKDIANYRKEEAYPYLSDNYYNQNQAQYRPYTWGRFKNQRMVNFFESSGGSSESDAGEGTSNSTTPLSHPTFLSRGQRGRGRSRPWEQYPGERQTRRKFYRWGPQYP